MAASLNPNPNLSRSTARAAVDALLKWHCTRAASQPKAPLFGDGDDLLYAVLTLRRIPSKTPTKPRLIPLPHSLHPLDPSSTSICLFSSDPLSPPPDLPISTVIPLADLRTDYRPFEARRKLCDSHDLFFADRRIIPLLPRSLGKSFFKRKKIPIAIDLSRPGWPHQLKKAVGSTMLYLRGGTCCALKIGRVSMEKDDIVDNLIAAIEGSVKLVPKKWANVRSIHIKLVDSVALPIFQAVPEMGFKIEGLRSEESVKDEIFIGEEKELKSSKKRAASKGRIHEVDYLDKGVEDGGSGSDSEEVVEEKRVKKKMKKEDVKEKKGKKGDVGVDTEVGSGKGAKLKVKKELKSKRVNKDKKEDDELVVEDDEEMSLGDEEEEEVVRMALETAMKKKKKKLSKKASGDRGDDGEENGSGKLKTKKMVKNTSMLVSSDQLKKGMKSGKVEGKDAKKSKRNK